MIFNWISRCWGGMGVGTRFEKARINCSIADWTVPYEDDILILITSFQDKNPQIPAKSALNVFLSHLETDEQKAHPAFLLKHLYVLDHCVQQMTALDTVGYYYNSGLASSAKSNKNIDTMDIHSPLRQLISSYYSYLIVKARNYSRYENSYFSRDLQPLKGFGVESKVMGQSRKVDDQVIPSEVSLQNGAAMDSMYNSGKKKKTRECTREQRSIESLFQKETSYLSIFEVIDKCQQIQAYIVSMNNMYAQGNRKVDLIKFIFIMLLRTYIRCYVIVSVGIRYLFKSFMSMSIKQLEKFIKTFQNFNNQYTQNFINFVESNRDDIEIFRDINYTELTYLKKDGMKVLTDYKEELRQKDQYMRLNSMGSMKNVELKKPANLSVLLKSQFDDMKIMELPTSVQNIIRENMKIFYKPRKNMDFYLLGKKNRKINDTGKYADQFEEETADSSFFTYESNYHQTFSTPYDDLIDTQMTTSKKSQLSSSSIPLTNSTLKNLPQDTANEIQKAHKSGISLREKSDGMSREQTVDKYVTKSSILSYQTLKIAQQPIKPLANNEIRDMFELKKKSINKIDQTWGDWQNLYADNTSVPAKH